jgi:hypothetical protein
MEIKKDYSEVLLMLEGVLLHIFRGIKGTRFRTNSISISIRLGLHTMRATA